MFVAMLKFLSAYLFSLQELVLPVCSTNLSDSSGVDELVVKEKSIIFTKHISDYQKAINAASFELCMTTASLLLGKKGDLYTGFR